MVRLDTIGNKFEFISIAAERCKQLQRGARPRLDSVSRKHITVAQEEEPRDPPEGRQGGRRAGQGPQVIDADGIGQR